MTTLIVILVFISMALTGIYVAWEIRRLGRLAKQSEASAPDTHANKTQTNTTTNKTGSYAGIFGGSMGVGGGDGGSSGGGSCGDGGGGSC
jgi:uncharacterized membrane protein YfcA